MKGKRIRTTMFIAVLSVSLLVTLLFFMFRSRPELDAKAWIMIMVQLVVVVFAIVFAFRRLRSAKENMPAEDEMSKDIKRRASSTAYYLSLYLWLAMMFLEEYIPLERHTLIGGGILGMALIFAGSWLFHKNFRRSHD